MCAGKNQSPVDMKNFIEAELPAIVFSYQAGGNEIVNNGHTIQVNYGTGSHIVIDETRFELKQFHFHAPSENLINGKSFPLEGHLVHADEKGNLAVVAIMFDYGDSSGSLSPLWHLMPEKAGGKQAIMTSFSAAALLPTDRDYYRFSGSLTTPPCSEGVRWLVMKNAVTVSREQVESFSHILHHPNNRPVQPVYARTILK